MTVGSIFYTILLFGALSVQALRKTIIQEKEQTLIADAFKFLGAERFPDLGRFKHNFTITAYVATGGQATVWKGRELRHNRPVVFRFLHGLCDEGKGRCRVKELSQESLHESQRACELAAEISMREKIWLQTKEAAPDLAKGGSNFFGNFFENLWAEVSTNKSHRSGMSHCIKPVDPLVLDDPAFEVWSYAGDVTLAEGFFMKTELGVLTMEEKHNALRMLSHYVSIMSDGDVEETKDWHRKVCCCWHDDRSRCTIQPLLSGFMTFTSKSRCPSDYVENEHGCGPIVHHDIKFDNVMLTRETKNSDVQLTLIDWGASVRCDAAQADSFSEDWFPVWLEDPRQLPPECWSYDTYSVGLAWLTTELLQNLSSTYLINRLQTDTGWPASEPKCDPICAHFPVDAETREKAMLPVRRLVSDLHELLRGSWMMLESSQVFFEAMLSFVEQPRDDGLTLTQPARSVLDDIILPMLQECPLNPSSFGPFPIMRDQNDSDRHALQLLNCRIRKASRELSFAITANDKMKFPYWLDQLQAACDELTILFDIDAQIRGDMSELGQRCNSERHRLTMSRIMNDNVDHVKALVDARPQLLSELLPGGESWLAFAARARAKNVVQFLVDRGADPLWVRELPGSGGLAFGPRPALFAAAMIPDNLAVLQSLVRALVAQGPSGIDGAGEILGNIIILGSAMRCESMHHPPCNLFRSVKIPGPNLLALLAKHGDVTMLSWVIDTIAEGQHGTRKLLLEALNTPSDSELPMLAAAEVGDAAKLKLLFRKGASKVQMDKALFLATVARSLDTVRVLSNELPDKMKHKIGNYKSLGQGGALHVAVKNGDDEILRSLVSLGIDVSLLDNRTLETPLHLACRLNMVGAVKILGKFSAAQLERNGDRDTPLQLSARRCPSEETLKILFDQDLNESKQLRTAWDSDGNTLLMAAIAAARLPEDKLPCIRFLLSRLPVDGRGAGDRTPLMVAMETGHASIIKMLIQEYKADPRATCQRGRPVTFFAWLQSSGDQWDTFAAQNSLTALVDATNRSILLLRDPLGMSVLGRWAFDANVDMVRFLIEDLRMPCRSHFAANAPKHFVNIFGDCGQDPSSDRNEPLSTEQVVRKRLRCITTGHTVMDQYMSGKVERKPVNASDSSELHDRLYSLLKYLGPSGCGDSNVVFTDYRGHSVIRG